VISRHCKNIGGVCAVSVAVVPRRRHRNVDVFRVTLDAVTAKEGVFRMKALSIRYEAAKTYFFRLLGDNYLTRDQWRRVNLPQISQQVNPEECRRFGV